MTVSLGLGLIGAGIWLYLLLFRGGFWAVRLPAPSAGGATPRIVAVIPARNEADGIAAAVGSLLSQDYPGELLVVVVDDHSEDATAAIAAEAAVGLTAGERLSILSAPPLLPGWTGKIAAVNAGIAYARTLQPDLLLLTDADIVHAPSHVATLVARAAGEQLDLTSEMVLLRCESLPEKTLIPAFVFFFLMLYPPRWVRDPWSRTAAAAGGCMLVRPDGLERIGGIGAIRGALIDDCALAAKIKGSGGRIRLDVTREAWSIREYRTAGSIWAMIARTAYTQLHYSPLLLAGTLLGLGVTYLAPPLLVLFCIGAARLVGLGVWLAMAVAFWPTIRLYRLNPVWTLALPGIAAFYAAATLGSAIAYWRGAGGAWKGRLQATQ